MPFSLKNKGKEIMEEELDSAPSRSDYTSYTYSSAAAAADGDGGDGDGRGGGSRWWGRRKSKGKDVKQARNMRNLRNSLNGNIPTTTENYIDHGSLEDSYARLAESEEVKKKLNKIFRSVRIMVVGRSGSGKTTIIRLVMGDKGPRHVADQGKRGDQDINVEWRHPDPEVPLVFHDTNGIDPQGAERLREVVEFVDEHQKQEDFEKKIHVVWYVFNVIDNRFLDDGGLLKTLDSRYGASLPIILVMTHKDMHEVLKKSGLVPPMLGEPMLDELLARISEPTRRRRARERMVHLGNRVQLVHGSIQGVVDEARLKLLVQRTKEVMRKELHWTWAAAQAVDTHEKLNASAEFIISSKRNTILCTWAVGALPGAQACQVGVTLFTITKCLAKIWKVPPGLERVLMEELLWKEGKNGVLRNVLYDVGAAIGLAGTVAAVVLTGGIASLLVTVYMASATAQTRGVSHLVILHSLLVSGLILYARAHKPVILISASADSAPSDDHNGIASTRTTGSDHLHFRQYHPVPAAASTTSSSGIQHHDSSYNYLQLCDAFANSKHAAQLKLFAKNKASLWQSPLNRKDQRKLLKDELLHFFNDIARDRPGSLSSQFRREDVDDGHAGSNIHGAGSGAGGLTITAESDHVIESGTTTISSGQHYVRADDVDDAYGDRQPLLHDAEAQADPHVDGAEDIDIDEYIYGDI